MLTKEQFRQSRTPSELKQWIEDVKNQARNHQSDIDAADLLEDSFKVFYEEVWAVHLFALGERLDDDYRICFPVDDGKVDAWISCVKSSFRIPLQITVTGDYEDALRREYQNTHKAAPLAGPIWRDEETREVEVIDEVKSGRPQNYFETIRRIKEVIDKKLEKEYPPGTWLLVGFDDCGIQMENAIAQETRNKTGQEWGYGGRSDIILDAITKHVHKKEDVQFDRIYLVGLGGTDMGRPIIIREPR